MPRRTFFLCAQSLIADTYSSATRGRAFGLLFLTSGLGGMAGAFFATSIGGNRPFGIEGWRFAFFTVAGISVLSGILTVLIASDPRKVGLSALLQGWDPFPRGRFFYVTRHSVNAVKGCIPLMPCARTGSWQ